MEDTLPLVRGLEPRETWTAPMALLMFGCGVLTGVALAAAWLP